MNDERVEHETLKAATVPFFFEPFSPSPSASSR